MRWQGVEKGRAITGQAPWGRDGSGQARQEWEAEPLQLRPGARVGSPIGSSGLHHSPGLGGGVHKWVETTCLLFSSVCR